MKLSEFKKVYSDIYKSPSDFNLQNSSRFDLFLRYLKIGFKLEDYQVPAAYVIAKFPDIWYTDAPGMGKTPTTIAAMSDMYHNGKTKFLVVVLASIIGQWKDSFSKFSTFDVSVVKGQKNSRYSIYEAFQKGKSDVLLISYTTLITDFEIIKKFHFDVMICDESDFIKSTKSLSFQCVQELSRKIRSIKLLTGTPFTGKLEDSFYAIVLLTHERFSYFSLLRNFCVQRKVDVPIYDKKSGAKRMIKTNVIDSYKNIEQFKGITDGYIFGRSFEETGATLPQTKDFFIQVAPSEKLLAFQKLALSGVFIQPNKEKIKLNSLQKISYLHRATHGLSTLYPETTVRNPKKEALLNLLDQFGKEQVAIFCNYKKVPEEIYDILEERGGCSRCDGGIIGNSRLNSLEKFKDGTNQFLVLTLAGYAGVDLWNCHNLVIYDFIYNRAKFEQIKGRIVRKNSINPVSNIYYIFCKGTIDEAVWALLERRKNLMNFFETEESVGHEILEDLQKIKGIQLSIL